MKIEKYIKDLQNKEFEMLLDIDKVCKKHNIEYYLYYGSVLGAVRHDGFIPWDDDIDIALKYDDYLKLLKYLEEDLDPKKYYVQTYNKEKNYYLLFAKLRNIQTTLVEVANKDKDIIKGVYIDIFPIVGVPNNFIKRKFLEINRAFAISAAYEPIINNKFLRGIFLCFKKIFGRDKLIEYCYKQCIKYSCDSCEELCSIFCIYTFNKNSILKKDLEKPLLHKYNNAMLPIPHNYDAYLKNVYGDYMKFPSEKQIKDSMHAPYFLDLDLPYEEYVKRGKNEKNKS